VLEQKKSDHQLSIFGRPADVGKRLPIFILKILPGHELRDPKPAVALVEIAAERKKLGKKRPGAAVFRTIHGLRLLRKVHGFRGIESKIRALEALNLPII
jgi:hypothetical protein